MIPGSSLFTGGNCISNGDPLPVIGELNVTVSSAIQSAPNEQSKTQLTAVETMLISYGNSKMPI